MESYRPNFGNVPHGPRDSAYDAFCGPTALAILTGRDVRAVVSAIARARKQAGNVVAGKHKRPRRAVVVGISVIELLRYIESCGLVPVDVTPKRKPVTPNMRHSLAYGYNPARSHTLGAWLRETREERGDNVYLVATTSHFLLVSGDSMVDNQAGGTVRPQSKMKYKKARIHDIYCIMRDPDFKPENRKFLTVIDVIAAQYAKSVTRPDDLISSIETRPFTNR
jgi:hypothetical protein